uniref:Uncharacterized protein n=1 Tax=Bracon brevicornis TaxID=1563983 RepID=A0A6V7HTS0_9HYME
MSQFINDNNIVGLEASLEDLSRRLGAAQGLRNFFKSAADKKN